MKENIYNFQLKFDWRLLNIVSKLDRFDASWSSIEKISGQNLKQLKSFATIKSVGASTRIEGSKMTDEDVKSLINNIDISKIEDRDSQEVVGYFNALDLILDEFNNIEITESNIKNIHNQLLKLSKKDEWHRGDYKQHANAVEANFPDGTRQVIFQTTEPGVVTEDAMRNLIAWFAAETEVHPIIRTAAFVYDFVSIHPFQDGNGRLSRLLTTLIMMKFGYQWIQYISFEHEIENRKKDYYKALRSCQAQRPNEDITEWIDFFLESLLNVQEKLEVKLKSRDDVSELLHKEKLIYNFIEENSGCKSGGIAKALNIPNSTVKRLLAELVSKGLISKNGKGAGTNYSI